MNEFVINNSIEVDFVDKSHIMKTKMVYELYIYWHEKSFFENKYGDRHISLVEMDYVTYLFTNINQWMIHIPMSLQFFLNVKSWIAAKEVKSGILMGLRIIPKILFIRIYIAQDR